MSKQIKIDPAVLEYVAEGKEIIERISKNLSLIEAQQFNQDVLNLLYRDVHTLKGSSQLFGFKLTGQVSHTLEACLDPVRRRSMDINPQMMRACVKNTDLLDRLIASIESTGKEFEDESEVIKLISLLIETSTQIDQAELALIKDSIRVEETEHKQAINILKENDNLTKVVKTPVKNEERMSRTSQFQESTDKAIGAVEISMASESGKPGTNSQLNSGVNIISAGEATVRVHVALLDRILNLIGELVLVRNQLLQFRHKVDNADFQNTSKSLDVVTSELQGEVMKTRMQPVETVVGKFQRVVRDIAREMNKKIDLTLEGIDTELDKSMLEAIKDPLTHIVRNSCDHGIEFPDERVKANKPETGHLLIRSFHEGGQVVIEISDDGRGINRKRVLQKAIEKGMMTAEQGSKLSDREICALIFSPGFSTAQQVTSVSGRGVGMDVVKTNIEKIGGSVEIKSIEGKGTSLQLRIPLTLAIVPALIIKSNREKFAIPQVKLIELVRVQGRGSSSGTSQASGIESGATTQIELLQGRPMFRLRGSLLPLYDLREITGESYDSSYKDGVFIVVLNSDGEVFGLLVPEVLDTADIVVKPISSLLNTVSTFSGATILGDGSIALILDVGGVAVHGKVINKRNQKEDLESFSKQERTKISSDIQEFLLFTVGTNAVHSVPLCLVNRLEEFSEDEIEQSGEQKVVRYRGSLLPLINLKSVLKYNQLNSKMGLRQAESLMTSDRTSVIVVQRSGRNYGLIVDKIVDVMTIDGQIDDTIRDRNGILGNILFNNEVVVVVDALGVIEDFNRLLMGKNSQGQNNSAPRDVMGELRGLNKEMKFKSVRVLYVEDVAFFRKHVSNVLAAAGIDVTTIEDGVKALSELESSESDRYNLILSDIEMPNMNGLELARELRKRQRFQKIPMIALTTRYREHDIQEGKKAGFNKYLEKLNPEKLLEAIHELMSASDNKLEPKDNSMRGVL